MPGDYIPSTDADFDNWQDNFVNYCNANLAALGLVAADMTPVVALQTVWKTVFPAVEPLLNAYTAGVAAKDSSRGGYIGGGIRPLVARIQVRPATTNAQRASLGITIPDTNRTPVPVPTSQPLATVDCGMPLQHTINFRDAQFPDRRGKPAGVSGVEIWFKVVAVGATPPTRAEMAYAATDTRSPYVLTFDAPDLGKLAYYSLRWVNASGQAGPWSEIVVATVTG